MPSTSSMGVLMSEVTWSEYAGLKERFRQLKVLQENEEENAVIYDGGDRRGE